MHILRTCTSLHKNKHIVTQIQQLSQGHVQMSDNAEQDMDRFISDKVNLKKETSSSE